MGSAIQQHDIELAAGDVQVLAGADQLSAFFGRLGYNTNARTLQTAGNLGITADSELRRIRRIELIADQEGLFQVYLFELSSVTVADARALAGAFRNRVGNFLLVLTSNFERIDFVLVEKYLPADTHEVGIAKPQVKVRPRVLSVDRRKPNRVQLRVLRRFTWTESDPFAQYEKLVAAYAVAYWSEDHFNNRALFSDYFLRERLTDSSHDFPEWGEDAKPAYRRLREIYEGARGHVQGGQREALRTRLMRPMLEALGFRIASGSSTQSPDEPDYRLYGTGDAPVAACIAYPWGRFLDGKDDRRDTETPDHNPGQRVVSLLEKAEAPWIVLTNGRIWRLYSPRARSRATNYYEVDLEESLGLTAPHPSGPADSFRYFWLFFRRQSFEPAAVSNGKAASLLGRLFDGSQQYAAELGENLKRRVFEKIFPLLAEGFVAHIRKTETDTPVTQDKLDEVFQGVLTLLYRVLFLLYAESRDLLPVETADYYEASITKVKNDAAEAAGTILEEVPDRIRKHFTASGYALYERMRRLFRVIDRGDPDLNMPRYNGGLFISEPAVDDSSAEAAAARFLDRNKVSDAILAEAIDLLARDLDPKTHQLVSIDFKSLGVRQLGSIYEGLLEFKVRIADEKKAIVKEKARDVYVPFKDLAERERERAEAQRRIVRKGQVYLENDKGERKASGSYYTPDHIVSYIVENAVGPVLAEKFEAMRPRLREAEQWHRDAIRNARAKGENPEKYEKGAAVDNRWNDLVRELFDVKVLDPAMGSGHFLVETVDYVTDKMLAFLNGFLWNPAIAHLETVRETILDQMEAQGITIDAARLTDVNLLKRHVLKRCIYGVDLNPMAVELAKVSLWLHCFTLGAPLSFLDHHMRCGNSLIGVTVEEVESALEGTTGQTRRLFGSQFAGLILATDLMRHVGELSDVTTAQVNESKNEYNKASQALLPFKRKLDIYTSQWFREHIATNRKRRPSDTEIREISFLASDDCDKIIRSHAKDLSASISKGNKEAREIVEQSLNASRGKRFFHWELEFPEAYYGPRPGTARAVARLDNPGFDAVIGNPPYDVLSNEELGYDVSQDIRFFRDRKAYSPAIRGKNNLYKLFICQSSELSRQGGVFSQIVPMMLLGDDQSAGVRQQLLTRANILAVESFPQKDDARERVFPEAKLATAIFVARKSAASRPFRITSHSGRSLSEVASSLSVTPDEILRFQPANAPIPSCTQQDWQIAARLLANPAIGRLSGHCEAYQGEINETVTGKAGLITYQKGGGKLVIRGSMITLYALREASQGEDFFLKSAEYMKQKGHTEKSQHHKRRRVGWQESSPQNNFRRIIAAPIPADEFCNHLINYIPEEASALPLDFVLALLNSKLYDWLFRIGSTNAHVSHYQVLELPVPSVTEDYSSFDFRAQIERAEWSNVDDALSARIREVGVMPKSVVETLVLLSKAIQKLEARRVLESRSERSHLGAASQPIQNVIDRLFFKSFGLSDVESSYVEARLQTML